MGQSLPKRDVSVTSVNPSTSDMTSRRRQRRNGPLAVISCPSNPNVILGRALATFVTRVEYPARLD